MLRVSLNRPLVTLCEQFLTNDMSLQQVIIRISLAVINIITTL
jgi:hypothetical protein